jgi:hypothetical protein
MTSPLNKSASESVCWNLKLLAHHELGGFGGMGEGMAVQVAKDGRRIIWLAHESAPKNFTAVDVSDPRKPKLVVQADLPESFMRSNSLELSEDIMAVAYQTLEVGPAGFELFDVSVPEQPRSIAYVDASGPTSRGFHQLWFCDGEFVHMAAGAPDFKPTNPLDDQCYRIFDVRNPAKPVKAGRWWLPGTREGDDAPPPARHQAPLLDRGFRAHNTNVYPQRPDRCYLAYLDAGMFVMDISDKANPKPICQWDNSPPYTGLTHTVVPMFERKLLLVTDESTTDAATDWPKLIWILDARDEAHPVPISTCPMPPVDAYSWHSEDIVIGTFFNGGLRAYDITNPYQPKEVAAFVPPAPAMSPVGSIQLNDCFVDERQVVYTVDRFSGGLYILEMDF